MKLFGKRKKTTPASADEQVANTPEKKNEPEEDVNVPSYFSSDFQPGSSSKTEKKKIEHDIEELLAMDPASLNAKQRRVLRRYENRTSGDKIEDDVPAPVPAAKKDDKEISKCDGESSRSKREKETSTSTPKQKQKQKQTKIEEKNVTKDEGSESNSDSSDCVSSDSDSDSTSTAAENENNDEEKSQAEMPNEKKEQKSLVQEERSEEQPKPKKEEEGSKSVEEVALQLKGLNSKERRKLLRQLAAEYDQAFLDRVTEASKKIAEENEAKQAMEQKKVEPNNDKVGGTKRKADGGTPGPAKKKGKKEKDLSHLPLEERARREKQREMQKEAAERRASGEVLTRHPLNSERRRANRRKPGKAGKYALYKKQMKEKQENVKEFNAGGYHMRHIKKEESNYY